jgi:hypothetical protein
MRNTLNLVIVFIAFCSCNKTSSGDLVKSYIDAHNKHDIIEAMSYFDEDIEFELQGVWEKTGLENVRSLEVWDSTLNSHLKLESIRISGDTVFCKVIENNDWFRNIDVVDITHNPTIFIVEQDKIKKIIAVPSEELGTKIDNAMGSIMEWSQQNKDSTLFELLPNGEFIYSEESAKKWINLFNSWKMTREIYILNF